MTSVARPGSLGAKDLAFVGGLSLIGIGVPLWLSAASGAIGLPTIDDWVYTRAALSLFRTGLIEMPGHTAASIGQVVLVQPLLWISHGDPWAFTAFGLIATFIGLSSTYLLARQFLGAAAALLVVVIVEAFPGFLRESASFMTDIPGYALAILCLLLGVRWFQGERRRVTLAASLAVGVLAVSVREFAIAAPAAILVAAWARCPTGERVWMVVMSGSVAAGVALVVVLAISLPGYGGPPDPVNLSRSVILGPALVTLAAVLLPATVLAVARRMRNLSPGLVILGAGVGCWMAVVPPRALGGNVWLENGLAGDLLLSGFRDSVMGQEGWAASRQLALFGAILAATLGFLWGQRFIARPASPRILRRRLDDILSSDAAPLLLFLAAYLGELLAFASVGTMIDRYLYPMAPVAAIVLLRGAQGAPIGRSHAASHTALVWLGASAFLIAANSFAYDAARYRAGTAAVAMGFDAQTVDAGYEWVGLHGSGPNKPGSGNHNLTWYDDYWPSFRPCAVLSNSPLDVEGLELVREDPVAYSQYLFFGPPEPLFLYRATGEGCPAP
jgi:Dolichyl-phosphate-mannose-protein mannosyltransferase